MLCISALFVALLGLRRPMQREQLQWPVRLHLCGGGAIKAPDGGGYDAHAASRAKEQAQRHHCLNVLPPRPAEPCVFATWKPFIFFMWGDGRLSGIEIARMREQTRNFKHRIPVESR